jgi:hypothetical protein
MGSTSVFIDRRLAGRTLLQVLQSSLRLPPREAQRAVQEQRVRISGGVCTDPQRRLKVGQYVQLDAARAEAPTALEAGTDIVAATSMTRSSSSRSRQD